MGTDAQIQEHLDAGRAALEHRRWQQAYTHLRAAAAAGELAPDDLERLAEASWWTAHLDACIDARERAFKGYVEIGEPSRAAFVALMLVRHYGAKVAPASALVWLKRAERLLEETPPSAAHGYLALIRATAALNQGEFDRSHSLAGDALEFGRRFQDRVLEVRATHLRGSALLRQGQVEEGLSLIDEAVAAAVGGDLGADAIGTVYCNTIEACHDLADIRRAAEWTEMAKRWCDGAELEGFPGICRVYRAEVSRLRGHWSEAEQEVRRACNELQDFNRVAAGAAFNELGELWLRRGELSAAEEAFQRAYELGHSAQPGVALLRYARGQTASAMLAIEQALEDEPRRPLARARLLPAQVEIALALGQSDVATTAAAELQEIAARFGTPALRASAETARAATEMDKGNAAAASRHLRQALRLWVEVDAPYESAKTRLLLAKAHQIAGDTAGATMELRAAKSTFDVLGASLDAECTDRLLAAREDTSPGAAGETGDWQRSLRDRFAVTREIGRGGMATVYLAEDRRHRRQVAVKVLAPELSSVAPRFLSEVGTLSRLNHPHIVPLFDSGEAAGHLYFVMPFISGESLRDRLSRDRKLSVPESVRLALEVADALGYAHSQGVVHRDIKPENVLLQHGHALVTDFGISRAIDAASAGSRLTQTGLLIGTPAYMSPEQVLSDPEIDGRSDIYSLGCVLFEMLTGEPPFSSASVQGQLAQRLMADAPSPQRIAPSVPPALDATVRRALAPDARIRFATAAALIEALSASVGVTL